MGETTLTNAGSIAAIVSGAVLVCALFTRWAKSQWNKAHPFFVKVSLDPYDFKPTKANRRDRRFTKQMNLELGDNHILICVSPRRGTLWDRVNIRLVNRKFRPRLTRMWKYEDSDQDVIQVTDFRDVIFERKGAIGGRYFEYDSDSVGEYDGLYDPRLSVKEGELVWFDVYIRANDIWNGFASFEAALENRRAWARIRAKVNMPKVIREDGKEERLTKEEFYKIHNRAS